jgi:hypothetical protein
MRREIGVVRFRDPRSPTKLDLSRGHARFLTHDQSRIINRFLIETAAFGGHVRVAPGPSFRLPGVSLGRPFQEYPGTTQDWAVEVRARND